MFKSRDDAIVAMQEEQPENYKSFCQLSEIYKEDQYSQSDYVEELKKGIIFRTLVGIDRFMIVRQTENHFVSLEAYLNGDFEKSIRITKEDNKNDRAHFYLRNYNVTDSFDVLYKLKSLTELDDKRCVKALKKEQTYWRNKFEKLNQKERVKEISVHSKKYNEAMLKNRLVNEMLYYTVDELKVPVLKNVINHCCDEILKIKG